jgi:hypothetical protein
MTLTHQNTRRLERHTDDTQRLVRHTAAARISSMESEKLYLQNLCGELNRTRMSVKDRIEAIDRQIMAEKVSVSGD